MRRDDEMIWPLFMAAAMASGDSVAKSSEKADKALSALKSRFPQEEAREDD